MLILAFNDFWGKSEILGVFFRYYYKMLTQLERAGLGPLQITAWPPKGVAPKRTVKLNFDGLRENPNVSFSPVFDAQIRAQLIRRILVVEDCYDFASGLFGSLCLELVNRGVQAQDLLVFESLDGFPDTLHDRFILAHAHAPSDFEQVPWVVAESGFDLVLMDFALKDRRAPETCKFFGSRVTTALRRAGSNAIVMGISSHKHLNKITLESGGDFAVTKVNLPRVLPILFAA